MSTPTSEWERVGDRFYRKVKLYEAVFDQDLELENYVISGAPYGGAIGKEGDHTATPCQVADHSQLCTATRTSSTHIEEIKPPKLALTSTAALAS